MAHGGRSADRQPTEGADEGETFSTFLGREVYREWKKLDDQSDGVDDVRTRLQSTLCSLTALHSKKQSDAQRLAVEATANRAFLTDLVVRFESMVDEYCDLGREAGVEPLRGSSKARGGKLSAKRTALVASENKVEQILNIIACCCSVSRSLHEPPRAWAWSQSLSWCGACRNKVNCPAHYP